MSTLQYHINGRGEPAICPAKISCRLKSDHFDTEEEARQAYEKNNTDQSVAKLTKKTKVADIKKVAASSDNINELFSALNSGSKTVMPILAKNENINEDISLKLYELGGIARTNVVLNKAFPPEKINVNDINELNRIHGKRLTERIVSNPKITPEQINYFLEQKTFDAHTNVQKIIDNAENLDSETLHKMFIKKPSLLVKNVNDPRIDFSKTFQEYDPNQQKIIATHSTDVNVLSEAVKHGHVGVVANNKNSTREILEEQIANPENLDAQTKGYLIYADHLNLSGPELQKIAGDDEYLNSHLKISRMAKNDSSKLEEFYANTELSIHRRANKRTIDEKVYKNLGLNKTDANVLLSSSPGSYIYAGNK